MSPMIGIGLGLGLTRSAGGAAQYASFLPPTGYRWVFVTYLGERVTYLDAPVVALEPVNG